jgi:hypothetical protein
LGGLGFKVHEIISLILYVNIKKIWKTKCHVTQRLHSVFGV